MPFVVFSPPIFAPREAYRLQYWMWSALVQVGILVDIPRVAYEVRIVEQVDSEIVLQGLEFI
jgi:hypothetical protein